MCGEGDIECDAHNECAGNLTCGVDNCGVYHDGSRISAQDDCCTLYNTGNAERCVSDNDCFNDGYTCFTDGVCRAHDGSYCTNNPGKCGEGDGDCDADDECIGDLICGEDNAAEYHPTVSWTAGSTWDACTRLDYGTTTGAKCQQDSDCVSSSHWCFTNGHCLAYTTDSFCSSGECGEGDGDCDAGECAEGWVCGTDNCGSFHPGRDVDGSDCCVQDESASFSESGGAADGDDDSAVADSTEGLYIGGLVVGVLILVGLAVLIVVQVKNSGGRRVAISPVKAEGGDSKLATAI